ncbi:MAG TPA: GAF domain-containing protein, partial [Leptospiraceae bacterium]|nr:GAF domain-containing protein [Leptospiraceae bacterium]
MNPNPCDLEPIHLINELQDFGLIFIFSMHEDKIVATGENIFDYLEISPEEAFTISLDRIFPDYENLKKLLIEHLIEKKHLEYKLLFPFSTSFFVAVFRKSDDFFICELEREDSNQILFNTNNFFNQVQELNQIQTLNTFYQHIVNEVQKMTLFDRVVIYRFDPEFNGEVLAESRKDDSIDSILGFHFPSSDIPLPARAMYKQNPLRMIQAHFDRKIILVKNKNYSNYSFDLGSSYLRTPHEHHLEYLKNMQIATSICVALSDGNRLWGLIICHSREKAIPLPSIRQNLILLSRIAYRHLDLLIQNENSQTIIKLKDELMEIIGKIYQISFTEIAIIFEFNLDKLMTTFQADGAIILFGDVKIHRGEIPDPENFQKLISVLEEKSDSENFLTNDIKDLFLEGSLDSNLRGGLFSFPISSKKKDRIYFFKKDALQKIVWAGNKNEAFLREENRISPRKSFTRWIEIVKGKSTNWNFSLRDIKEELQGI